MEKTVTAKGGNTMTAGFEQQVEKVLKMAGSVAAALVFTSKRLAEALVEGLDLSVALWEPLADHFGVLVAEGQS